MDKQDILDILHTEACAQAHDLDSSVKLLTIDERDNLHITKWQTTHLDGVQLCANQMVMLAEERKLTGYAVMIRSGNGWKAMVIPTAGQPGECFLLTPMTPTGGIEDWDATTSAKIDGAAPTCLDDEDGLSSFRDILAGSLIERKELHKRLVKANLWKGQAK